MRRYVFSLVIVIVGLSPLAAQNAKKADPLGSILTNWEKAMMGLQSYVAVIDRTTIDKALAVKETHRGYTMLSKADKKAGIQARLECVNTENQKSFEKYIYSGEDLYEYVPANNTVRHLKLAKNAKGVVQQDTFVSLVLGMTVKHVKQRFDLTLDNKAPVDGYDYVIVTPKDAKDRAEFSVARLAFDRKNHLIAQIWFRQANGKEITWDFSKMQINVQIPRDYFDAVVPTGWRMDRVKAPLTLPKLAP